MWLMRKTPCSTAMTVPCTARYSSRTLLSAVAICALVATGCGGGSGSTGRDSSGGEPGTGVPTSSPGDDGATAASATVALPERFEGSEDDFYVVPDPLPSGNPGDLIRYQDLGTTELPAVDGSTGSTRSVNTVRVMYHSNDASGTDRATTGIVTYPEGEDAPEDGWPVVSYAHGTAGLAPSCALSRDGQPAPDWGVQGVSAATDYVGLGPVGEIHPYLSKFSEGNAVIDIVTAAGQVPASGAGSRWVAIGHSQGGHAALAAHELAAKRAPDLSLAATVALAPGVGINESYGGTDDLLTTVLTMMEVYGGATEHEEIEVGDYFTPDAVTGAEVFATGCVNEIVAQLTPVVSAGPFKVDPWSTGPAKSILEANQVGDRAVEGVPVFLALGTADTTVLPQRVEKFFDKLCRAGQTTEFQRFRGADHGTIIPMATTEVARFLNGALDGSLPPTDDCPGDQRG